MLILLACLLEHLLRTCSENFSSRNSRSYVRLNEKQDYVRLNYLVPPPKRNPASLGTTQAIYLKLSEVDEYDTTYKIFIPDYQCFWPKFISI